jgi:hypothetical protein
MSIKLHAIGIGDDVSFHSWWDRYQRPTKKDDPHVSIVPNHRLLSELVRVGGGDPQRVGGLEVLREYFAGLGEGVTRRVGRPARGALRQVQASFQPLAEPLTVQDAELARRRKALAEQARDLRPACETLSVRCGAKPMWMRYGVDDLNKLLDLGRPIYNQDGFRSWVIDLSQLFYELLESRLKENVPKQPYDIRQVRTLIWDGRMDRIRRLRNNASHAIQGPEDEIEIGKITQLFTGRKLIDYADSRQWTRLQVGLLESLVALLTDIRDALEELPVPSQPTAVPAVPFAEGYQ